MKYCPECGLVLTVETYEPADFFVSKCSCGFERISKDWKIADLEGK
jgi:acetone carboxylase gamma subunit